MPLCLRLARYVLTVNSTTTLSVQPSSASGTNRDTHACTLLRRGPPPSKLWCTRRSVLSPLCRSRQSSCFCSIGERAVHPAGSRRLSVPEDSAGVDPELPPSTCYTPR